MADGALALTIDIGTSSTRVLLWDLTGHEVPAVRAQVKYAMDTTPDGGVEMAAAELEHHVGACLDEALRQAGDRAAEIRVVGMSTFWHSMVGLNSDGEPLTPVYSWADTRSGEAARRLRHELDEVAIHARTGCMLHSSYYPAKLTWLRSTRAALYRSVSRWASPSEYLFGRWFGAAARKVSLSMASGTGLLNQDRSEWDSETLSALDLAVETLAPIVDLAESSSGLQPEFASRWPQLREVPFFPAVGDGACGNVGSGCVTPTRFAINLGTSGAIRALYREGQAPEAGPSGTALTDIAGLWRYRVDRRRPLIGAAFSDGGLVYEWMARTLRLPPVEELERRLAERPPVTDLTFLPFLAGERSLGWHPEARAALAGLNLNTGPVEILQAAMQAVALRFALAAQRLRALFPQSVEIVASGGALGGSHAWAQMFADAIGQPIVLASEPEASSRGAALLALEAAGLIGSTEEAEARLGATFTPNRAHHEIYVELLARQQEMYARIIEEHA